MEENGVKSNYPAEFRTRETADLFLVLLMKILKPGGRAGMVLPDGTLFGEGVKTRIKEALQAECNLHTIVRLPNGVFSPYTGIRTNLLFFTKGTPTKEIWFHKTQMTNRRKIAFRLLAWKVRLRTSRERPPVDRGRRLGQSGARRNLAR